MANEVTTTHQGGLVLDDQLLLDRNPAAIYLASLGARAGAESFARRWPKCG